MNARLVSIHVYPVKSCRGLTLPAATLGPRGLQHDRSWMIVDSRDRFLTQRTHPRLATIEAAPTATGDGLTLRAPLSAALRVAAVDEAAAPPSRRVQVWDDTVDAVDAGDVAAEWLQAVLGEPVRLVRATGKTVRQPRGPWRGDVVAPVDFPDGYPLLVCSVESLADLNRRLPEPIGMERFRPNLVLEGLGTYGEDRVGEMVIGSARLRLVKACTRCSTTSVDQATGAASTNPLPTLRSYRFDRELRGVTFGQNAVIVSGEGARLAVGDVAEVSQQRDAADPPAM